MPVPPTWVIGPIWTVLTEAVSIDSGSLSVARTIGFADGATFKVQVGSECMNVTNAGLSWPADRSIDNTPRERHFKGDKVFALPHEIHIVDRLDNEWWLTCFADRNLRVGSLTNGGHGDVSFTVPNFNPSLWPGGRPPTNSFIEVIDRDGRYWEGIVSESGGDDYYPVTTNFNLMYLRIVGRGYYSTSNRRHFLTPTTFDPRLGPAANEKVPPGTNFLGGNCNVGYISKLACDQLVNHVSADFAPAGYIAASAVSRVLPIASPDFDGQGARRVWDALTPLARPGGERKLYWHIYYEPSIDSAALHIDVMPTTPAYYVKASDCQSVPIKYIDDTVFNRVTVIWSQGRVTVQDQASIDEWEVRDFRTNQSAVIDSDGMARWVANGLLDSLKDNKPIGTNITIEYPNHVYDVDPTGLDDAALVDHIVPLHRLCSYGSGKLIKIVDAAELFDGANIISGVWDEGAMAAQISTTTNQDLPTLIGRILAEESKRPDTIIPDLKKDDPKPKPAKPTGPGPGPGNGSPIEHIKPPAGSTNDDAGGAAGYGTLGPGEIDSTYDHCFIPFPWGQPDSGFPLEPTFTPVSQGGSFKITRIEILSHQQTKTRDDTTGELIDMEPGDIVSPQFAFNLIKTDFEDYDGSPSGTTMGRTPGIGMATLKIEDNWRQLELSGTRTPDQNSVFRGEILIGQLAEVQGCDYVCAVVFYERILEDDTGPGEFDPMISPVYLGAASVDFDEDTAIISFDTYSDPGLTTPTDTVAIVDWADEDTFNLYDDEGAEDPYQSHTSVVRRPKSHHDVEIPGLSSGVTYHYRVTAANSAVEQDQSDDDSFTMP